MMHRWHSQKETKKKKKASLTMHRDDSVLELGFVNKLLQKSHRFLLFFLGDLLFGAISSHHRTNNLLESTFFCCYAITLVAINICP